MNDVDLKFKRVETMPFPYMQKSAEIMWNFGLSELEKDSIYKEVHSQ